MVRTNDKQTTITWHNTNFFTYILIEMRAVVALFLLTIFLFLSVVLKCTCIYYNVPFVNFVSVFFVVTRTVRCPYEWISTFFNAQKPIRPFQVDFEQMAGLLHNIVSSLLLCYAFFVVFYYFDCRELSNQSLRSLFSRQSLENRTRSHIHASIDSITCVERSAHTTTHAISTHTQKENNCE